jgi:TfoX/Sxy family transcriptional regulator of competence genes
MAVDGDLSDRVRAALADRGSVREVKMFGGIGFMLNGNLALGSSKRGLLVRVGKENQADALARPGARPMIMRGRAMDGYVYVDPPALDSRSVRAWVQLAISFVETLPPKAEQKSRRTKEGQKRT